MTGVLISVSAITTGCATTQATSAHRELIRNENAGSEVGKEAPNEKTLYSMAKIFISQKKYREGELILFRSINEFPQFTPAYAELANMYMKQERVEDARLTLRTAVERNDRDPLILNNLGICELLLGDFGEAQAHFNKASMLVPQEKRYTANLALALAMNGDVLGSQKVYRKILSQEKVDHNMNVIAKMKPEQEGGLELFDLHFE
jgi:Flp pilus assembly protein TadD